MNTKEFLMVFSFGTAGALCGCGITLLLIKIKSIPLIWAIIVISLFPHLLISGAMFLLKMYKRRS